MITKPTDLPRLPGVYIFKDGTGQVLYIGKAKSLATRVASYFSSARWQTDPYAAPKIADLLNHAQTIEHIVTRSEQDAILLEEHLIKLYQPPYNILLKSGDPFLYLRITQPSTTTLPELEITRTKEGAGTFYGPFTHRRAVRHSYEYLVKRFQLYRCTTNLRNGCLKYHLGICAGTCTGTFDAAAYRVRIALVQSLLAGDTEGFLATLHATIAACHAALKFEEARQLHSYEENLQELFATIARAFSPESYHTAVAQAVTAPPTWNSPYQEAQAALSALLGAASAPVHTIDCFDISHIQGRHMVGSAIRFTDGIPDPAQFRRFKIRSLTTQNDYAALQEVITRRYRSVHSYPDMILIDGGKGQLSAAHAVAPPGIPLMSLAKREERIFTEAHRDGIVLDPASPVGRLLISLRDYAHRYALTYHKLLSRKELRSR